MAKPDPNVSRAAILRVMSDRKLKMLPWATAAGMAEGTLRNFLAGKANSMRSDTYAALADAAGVTVDQLLGVDDDMPPAAPDDGGSTERPWPAPGTVHVAEIDVHASAGHGALVDMEQNGGSWGFPEPWLRSELHAAPMDLRVITIEGDSMVSDPPRPDDLLPGDKVVVNVAVNARRPTPPGKFVVFDGLGLVAKVVSYIPGSDPARIRLMSRNAAYEPYERTLEEAHIVGRIVGRWQRM
jgi:phage repressor protein C with HTH and peptisase S24 domain